MQFVTYLTSAGTTAGGYIADRMTSPLTHMPRVLVVDSYAEAKNPAAGKWIPESHVIERGICNCPVCKVIAKRSCACPNATTP